MNCEKTIFRFIEQEDYTHLPLTMRMHLYFCPQCRDEIKKIQKSFIMVSEIAAPEVNCDLTASIMTRIEDYEKVYERNISNLKWIVAGIFLFGGILCIPFNNNLTWLNEYFGGNIEVTMALVLGTAMSIYAAIFAGSHLSFVNKDRIIKILSRFMNV